MRKYLTCLFIALLFPVLSVSAQIVPGSLGYYNDALRFSRTSFSGTARFQGLAGAHSALGGDLSNITNNPAGLAFYRRSEFTLTPSLLFANTSTDYFDVGTNPVSNTADNKFNFNINNVGAVFSSMRESFEPGEWRGGTFGISLSRVNNFQNRFRYEGRNTSSSKTDFYVEQSNGIPEGDLENLDLIGLEYQRGAYFAFLTNPFDAGGDQYFTFARDELENLFQPIVQAEEIENTGAQYQWSFSAAGNYADKLYFGATVGLMILNYEQDRFYSEEIQNENSFLDSFSEENKLDVNGTGVNATLGLIYRPNNLLRLGASFSSPTLYTINEEFNTTFVSNVYSATDPELLETYEEAILPGSFDYRLRTPWRATGGLALFFGKYGFVSADAEYVAYNSMKIRNREFAGDVQADNETIKNIFNPVWNIRLGGEFRYSIFRARAGFALEGDPYDDIDEINRNITRVTGGLGIRLPDGYVDLALVYSQTNSAYSPYSFEPSGINAGLEPFTQSSNRLVNILITGGVFF